MAASNEAIMEEIEALQAIMLDEVTVLHGECGVPSGVEVLVVPATAQNVKEQHVRVTLVITLPSDYPDASPAITLRNPRGVGEDVLGKIQQESKHRCEEYLGCPVIYELIEVVRDNLTANNTPSCPCAICLYHFTDADTFTKTQCFHYFHSYCLGRYITNCEEEAAAEEEEPQPAWMAREKKKLMCPVCRDPIQNELNGAELLLASPPEEEETTADFRADDPALVSLQQKMATLYLKQKEKGGIIDLEEEKNKFLLSSNNMVPIDEVRDNSFGEDSVSLADYLEDAPEEGQPPLPPASHSTRRGGRPSHSRPHGQKMHGDYGRQPWRTLEHGRDSHYFTSNRGERGGSGFRGRGSGRGGSHSSSRMLPQHKDYNALGLKGPRVIESSLAPRDHNSYPQGNSKYENGHIYRSGDNRAEMSYGARGGGNGNGSGKRGSKGSGGRQRYGPGRGRGRGPPSSFASSSQHHSAQDWS